MVKVEFWRASTGRSSSSSTRGQRNACQGFFFSVSTGEKYRCVTVLALEERGKLNVAETALIEKKIQTRL